MSKSRNIALRRVCLKEFGLSSHVKIIFWYKKFCFSLTKSFLAIVLCISGHESHSLIDS